MSKTKKYIFKKTAYFVCSKMLTTTMIVKSMLLGTLPYLHNKGIGDDRFDKRMTVLVF